MVNGVNANELSQLQNLLRADQRSQIIDGLSGGQQAAGASGASAQDVVGEQNARRDTFTSRQAGESQARIAQYESINRNLETARESGRNAVDFGDNLIRGLDDLRRLSQEFANSGGNDEERARISAQFEERARELGEFVAENQPQGEISAAARGGNSSALSVNLTDSRFDFGDIGNWRLDGDNPEAMNNLAAEMDRTLTTAGRFNATAQDFNVNVNRQITVNENLISSWQANATRAPEREPITEPEEAQTVLQRLLDEIRRLSESATNPQAQANDENANANAAQEAAQQNQNAAASQQMQDITQTLFP